LYVDFWLYVDYDGVMYYKNRLALGRAVARRISELVGEGLVVVVLKPSALTAATALAAKLRGFVLPYLTYPIHIESYKVPIGVVDQAGNFVYSPRLTSGEIFDIENNYGGFMESEKLKAMNAINKMRDLYGEVACDMKGRDCVLFADVLQDTMELEAAVRLFDDETTKEIIIAAGNVTDTVSNYLMEHAKHNFYFLHTIKDVFDDNHYFDNPAEYSPEQLREIMGNIQRHWGESVKKLQP
jgi:hypothetical protein